MFKVTNSGLSHVVGKIDDNTYFAEPKFFRRLNELAFPDQSEVTTTPEAAPRSEGLLASAHRLMTALFVVRTPKNVTTRNRLRKSNPVKLVSPTEISCSRIESNSSKVPRLMRCIC